MSFKIIDTKLCYDIYPNIGYYLYHEKNQHLRGVFNKFPDFFFTGI